MYFDLYDPSNDDIFHYFFKAQYSRRKFDKDSTAIDDDIEKYIHIFPKEVANSLKKNDRYLNNKDILNMYLRLAEKILDYDYKNKKKKFSEKFKIKHDEYLNLFSSSRKISELVDDTIDFWQYAMLAFIVDDEDVLKRYAHQRRAKIFFYEPDNEDILTLYIFLIVSIKYNLVISELLTPYNIDFYIMYFILIKKIAKKYSEALKCLSTSDMDKHISDFISLKNLIKEYNLKISDSATVHNMNLYISNLLFQKRTFFTKKLYFPFRKTKYDSKVSKEDIVTWKDKIFEKFKIIDCDKAEFCDSLVEISKTNRKSSHKTSIENRFLGLCIYDKCTYGGGINFTKKDGTYNITKIIELIYIYFEDIFPKSFSKTKDTNGIFQWVYTTQECVKSGEVLSIKNSKKRNINSSKFYYTAKNERF